MEVGLVVCQKVRVQIPLGSPQSKSLLVLLEIKFIIIPKLSQKQAFNIAEGWHGLPYQAHNLMIAGSTPASATKWGSKPNW